MLLMYFGAAFDHHQLTPASLFMTDTITSSIPTSESTTTQRYHFHKAFFMQRHVAVGCCNKYVLVNHIALLQKRNLLGSQARIKLCAEM